MRSKFSKNLMFGMAQPSLFYASLNKRNAQMHSLS